VINPPATPCADVWVEDVAVAPGATVIFTVQVRSRLEEAAEFGLSVVGLEAAWLGVPPTLGTVQPGETVAAEVQLRLPVGYPAATLVGSVSVAAAGSGPSGARPGGPGAASRPATADLRVTVGDGSLIGATLDPADVRGHKFDVVLRNRSKAPMRVDLTAAAPDENVKVRFIGSSPVLDPGRELRVKARIYAARQVFGSSERRHFTVRVQGRTTPVVLEGSVSRRPVVPSSGMKLLAILTVVALWVAVAIVGINALDKHVKKSATARAIASAPPLNPGGRPTGGKGTTGGSTSKGKSGRSGQSGQGKGGSSGGGAGGAGGGSGTDRVGGRVTAAKAGGVKVTIAPTSLVAAATEGALKPTNEVVTTAAITGGPVETAASEIPAGMVYAGEASASLDPQLTAATSPTKATTTAPDGTWAFAGIPAPGTYLVTFSKVGYTTLKYVVSTTTAGTITLNAALTAGNGAISGSVSGSNGPLGGATVTITDGTISVTTRTPSVGNGIGTWSTTGLTTPDTYLITATAPGYGTQTSVVTLGAGQSKSGINLAMSSGIGAITGTVSSAGGPLGGITVTASGGSTSVSATTSTVNPVGTYTLPDLPIPGTYALTVSGPGWVTQTQRVTLPDSKPVNAFLVASTGDIHGIVTIGAKDIKQSGVGLILSAQTQSYKTLTTDTGGYEFQDIPPGNYLLTAEYYGFQTRSAQLTVRAGAAPITRNLHLPPNGANTQNQAIIQGLAIDLFTSKPASDVRIMLNGKQVVVAGKDLVTSGAGTYTIPKVSPGLQQVELVDSNTNPKAGSVDLQSTDVQVTVPLNGVGVAPTAEMDKLDTYSGTVQSAADGADIAGATVQLVEATSGHAPVPDVNTATTAKDGNFSIGRIPAGNYEVVATGPVHADGSDDFETLTFPLTMAPDVDLQQQIIRLTLLPSFQVVTEMVNAAGTGFGPIGGVCVTLTDDNSTGRVQSKYSSQFPADHDEVFFGGLKAGDKYTATYAAYSSGTCATTASPATALPTTFIARSNNTAVDQVFVASKVPALTVPVSYDLVTSATPPTACPVQLGDGAPTANSPCASPATLPTVTLTGITSFDTSGNPLDTTITATYCDRIAACPAGSPASGIWFFSKSDLAKMIGPTATLTVGGDPFTFQPYTEKIALGTTNSINSAVSLSPLPVGISGSGPDIPDLTVAADLLPGMVPTLGVSVTGEGTNLVWSQVPEPTGEALPGEYSLTYSAPDYEANGTSGSMDGASSYTQTISVGLCNNANCVVSQRLDDSPLIHQPGVSITPTGIPAGVTATVSIYLNGVAIPADPAQEITTGGTATFTGLSPFQQGKAGMGPNTGYGFSVVAPGTANLTGDFPYYSPDTGNKANDPFTVLTIPNEPDLSLTPALTPAPSIGGSVTGTVAGSASALSGVPVTATLQGTCPTTLDQYAPPGSPNDTFPPSVTTTTASGTGTYLLSDQPVGAPTEWLCPGATYIVTVTDAGYQPYTSDTPGAEPVVTSTTGVETLLSPNLTASQITQPIDIAGAPAGTFVILEGVPVAGSTYYFDYTEDATTTTSCTPSVSATFCAAPLDPVPYDFSVYVNGFEPLTVHETYSPGSCPSLVCPLVTFTLVPDQIGISGTAQLGNAAATGVPNLKLDLDEAGDNPPIVVKTVTTGAGGSFTFDDVANGSYYITPDPSTGYELPGPIVDFTATYPDSLTEVVTVAATPVTLNVAASVAQLHDPNLNNATIKLTPDPGGDITNCAPGPPTSATAPRPECTGDLPLLATGGAGTTAYNGTLAPVGASTTRYSTQLLSLPPDVYLMTVSGNGIPTQTGIVVEVGPDTTNTDSATINVFEGEISGTVTWNSALQQAAQSPNISVSGDATFDPAPVCSPGSCTYTAYLPLGDAATISASLTGYNDATTGPVTVSAGAPSQQPATLKLTPINRTVQIRATSGGAGDYTLVGAQIKLVNPDSSAYDTTITATNGTATFDDVPPAATDYSVTISYLGAASSGLTLTVPLATSATPPDITSSQPLAAGKLTGTVNLATGQSATNVKLYFCTSSAAASAADCDGSDALVTLDDPGGTYTELLPVGSYWVGQSADAGFDKGTTETATTAVGQGTSTSGPTIVYNLPPPPTTTTTTTAPPPTTA
jgi:hypothetical protein